MASPAMVVGEVRMPSSQSLTNFALKMDLVAYLEGFVCLPFLIHSSVIDGDCIPPWHVCIALHYVDSAMQLIIPQRIAV